MRLATIALLLGAMMVLAGCTSASNSVTGNVAAEANANPAPDFEVTTTSGRTVSLDGLKEERKPAVVYFMASWCSTCAKNWDAMNAVYPAYEDKVDLIAVSVDPTDTDAVLRTLAANKGFKFDTVAGNPELAVKWGVQKQTAKFAIDKNGNIVSRHDGALSEQEWKAMFESLI